MNSRQRTPATATVPSTPGGAGTASRHGGNTGVQAAALDALHLTLVSARSDLLFG